MQGSKLRVVADGLEDQRRTLPRRSEAADTLTDLAMGLHAAAGTSERELRIIGHPCCCPGGCLGVRVADDAA
jgi:hypothetical protein